ncbi:hypothetical protein VQ056_17460 [Paenibacillus sp. JTLBN-2024]
MTDIPFFVHFHVFGSLSMIVGQTFLWLEDKNGGTASSFGVGEENRDVKRISSVYYKNMKFLSSLITLFRIAAEHSNNLRTTRGKLVMPAAMPASGQHPYSMYICGTKQKNTFRSESTRRYS